MSIYLCIPSIVKHCLSYYRHYINIFVRDENFSKLLLKSRSRVHSWIWRIGLVTLIMTEYEMVGYSLGSTTLSWKARTVQASQKLYNMYLLKQANSIEIVLCRENGLISGKENNVYCLYFKNHLSFKCKRRNFIFFFYITLLYFKIELSYQELNHL